MLKLNANSNRVLKKIDAVEIAVSARIERPSTSKNKATSAGLTPAENSLMSSLKALRKELADKQSVPPYVVFSDASLRQMSKNRPQTAEAFLTISGVGNRKLNQYGEVFTQTICDFCKANGLEKEFAETLNGFAHEPTSKKDITSTQLVTYDLYRGGLSLPEISLKRNIRLSTVNSHIAKLIEARYEIDLDRIVSKDRQNFIATAIDEIGPHSLRDIREITGETYDYQEIKLVRAMWESKKNFEKL